ncbi:MBL fold metallo-hydrolase [Geodermatophilus marinus]|uniref:MBL fold metallo-hydrolase n=1 Tax=Geodermatophilus sp. LHW52908 TaxID=2303986 RepID=UPI000E3B73E4|nr:MBL fold metallo-hydrolase [Geodermatophilus sp. LHW52908]RFU19404.1 MBL fold metallo-hydrolase [Geodermatophilus sp. LHW52908]
MASWHEAREISRGVWSIAEPSHVNMWLIEGRDRAVLLDTGLGIARVRPVVEELTTKPVSVVNTHYHFDHVGGNHEFDDTAIHEAGAALLVEPVPREVLDRYLAYALELVRAAEHVREADGRYFHLLDADSLPRPLPDGFDPAAWTIAPPAPSRTLTEGDVVDLGGRALRVLHTPGHSGDSICLLDDASGILFGGDTINTGPIYAQFHDSDVATFAKSAARLAELKDEVTMVAVNHFGRTTAAPYLLQEISDGFDRVLSGSTPFRQAHDCIGERVTEAVFDRFSILLAPAVAQRLHHT